MDTEKLKKIAVMAIRGGTQAEREAAWTILEKHHIRDPLAFLNNHPQPSIAIPQPKKTTEQIPIDIPDSVSSVFTVNDDIVESVDVELRLIQDELLEDIYAMSEKAIKSLTSKLRQFIKK